MKIAAVQMISGPDVRPNLDTASRRIAEAVRAGARLVALPEYFPLIGATDEARRAAREAPGTGPIQDFLQAREREGRGPIQDFLAETARAHGIWLVGGSIPLMPATTRDPDKLLNSCLVFDDGGRQVARYDKIHLFNFRKGDEHYDEAATIEAGDRVVAFDTPFGRIGLAICYDLRFPELFRALGTVDLLVIPAAFTDTTGRAHWETLLRARAVENQCYVLASAQGGQHPTGRMTHGNSMIIDPWGDVLARLDKGEGVVVAELDAGRIAAVRASLPALQHRRL